MKLLLVFILNLAPICTLWAADEQWLMYRSLGKSDEYVTHAHGHGVKLIYSSPNNVALPALKSSQPAFMNWKSPMLKDPNGILMVFDSSKGNTNYDILYVDTNCDANLANDVPVKGMVRGERQAEFRPVPVRLEAEDGPVTFEMKLSMYTEDSGDKKHITIWPGCWYEGELTIGDKKVKAKLVDQDSDGDFTTAACLSIGSNDEEHKVGKFIYYNDKYYTLNVAKDGAYVQLEPVSPELCELQVAKDMSKLRLTGDNGSFDVKLKDGKGMAIKGDYRVENWTIVRKDAKGNNWELGGSAWNNQINIEPNQAGPKKLALGEPILSRLDVSNNKGEYNFSQSFIDGAQSRIRIKKGQDDFAPKLHFVSADGKYDKKFSLEYG